MKEILKYIVWSGLAVILFSPLFVFSGLFFPYITSKAFAFRIAVEIIFGLWLVLTLAYKEYRPKFSVLLVSFALLTLFLLISDLLALNPAKAIWSNFERMEGFMTIVHLFGYFVVLSSVIVSEINWLWLWRANILAAVILGVNAVTDSGDARFSGWLNNPIYLGCYFLFVFFLSLILWYKEFDHKKDFWIKASTFIYWLVALFSLFIVYRTSRGVLIGLFGGVFLSAILIAVLEKKDWLLRKVSFGILGGVILLVGIFLGFRHSDFVTNNPTLSRLANISWQNTNGQARQYVWPIAIEGFKEHPVLGWGQEGFVYVFNKYYDPRMYNQETWFDRAHNTPLDFLIAGGLLGLLSYLALYFGVLYLLWFRKNHFSVLEKSLWTGLLAGYFFQSLFVFDNLTSYLFFFTVLAYLHSRLATREINFLTKIKVDHEIIQYVYLPIILVVVGALVYFVNYRPIIANNTLLKAMIYTENSKAEIGFNYFKEALTYNTFANSEVREQILVHTQQLIRDASVPDKTKKDFALLTKDELVNQNKANPFDVRYYYFLANFTNTLGYPDLAVVYAEKAVEMAPKRQIMKIELVRAYLGLQRFDDALRAAKENYDLEPSYDRAKQLYDQVLAIKNKAKK